MESFFFGVALALAVILLIPFYRVYRGPAVGDRLLGAAAAGTKTLTLVLLIGVLYDRLDMFVDISMGYAILNFAGVIAMSKYFRTQTTARR